MNVSPISSVQTFMGIQKAAKSSISTAKKAAPVIVLAATIAMDKYVQRAYDSDKKFCEEVDNNTLKYIYFGVLQNIYKFSSMTFSSICFSGVPISISKPAAATL